MGRVYKNTCIDRLWSSLIKLLSSVLRKLPMQLSIRVRVVNNLAGAEGINQRLQVHALFKAVLIAQVRNNGVGCLLTVVKRNPGEEMVNDMVVNNLVEEMASDETKSSVDGAKRTLDEGPCILIIVRDIRVSVV